MNLKMFCYENLKKYLSKSITRKENISIAMTSLFIGPRYPWSNLWVPVFLTATLSADLTHVTLADEDNNSIPTDDVNRAIIGNVAMQVVTPGGQTCNYSM